ncbi:outer membrane efflux protein, partial [Acidithiobacillus sp. GGI-221]
MCATVDAAIDARSGSTVHPQWGFMLVLRGLCSIGLSKLRCRLLRRGKICPFILIKKQRSIFIVLLMGTGASLPAAALDFNQCVDLALRQNPEMLVAHARQAEARGAVSEARGHLLPKLAASFSASQSNNALTVFGMKLSQRQATFNDFGAGQF